MLFRKYCKLNSIKSILSDRHHNSLQKEVHVLQAVYVSENKTFSEIFANFANSHLLPILDVLQIP